MGCLLVLLSAFAPRLIVVFAWIARPAYFGAVFDTWIFPLLGLIFLPFTTLIWLLVGRRHRGSRDSTGFGSCSPFSSISATTPTPTSSGTRSQPAWGGTPRHRPQRPRPIGDATIVEMEAARASRSSQASDALTSGSCWKIMRGERGCGRRSRTASAQDHAFAGARRRGSGRRIIRNPLNSPISPASRERSAPPEARAASHPC